MQLILETQKRGGCRRCKGITLVEILVVLGLFSGVATLALGALFNTQAINNKLLENQSILDNVNFSLQAVTRDIRYGAEFHCAATVLVTATTTRRDCEPGSGGGVYINFLGAEGTNANDRVAYYVEEGVLYKRESPFGVSPLTYQMTGRDIYITDFRVYIDGAYATNPLLSADQMTFDYTQPKITILLSGRSNPSRASIVPSTFSIETVVSSRLLDNI
jgi:type II secretory pathway pseudopilin PulG